MADLVPVANLRVDGGLSSDETLLQTQADALGLALRVGHADATVLGTAMLAGVGAGVFGSVEDAAQRLAQGRIVAPCAPPQERLQRRERWRAFVEAAAGL